MTEPTWSELIQAAMDNPAVPRDPVILHFDNSAQDAESASAACVNQVNGHE